MEINEILETITEQTIKAFVGEFWLELWKDTGDWNKSINTATTFSEFKCYKILPIEIQVMIDGICKTPSEFATTLRAFITEFIIDKTSICSKETFEFIGLPDLLHDYFCVKEIQEKTEFVNAMSEDEMRLLIKELSNVNDRSTFGDFTFYQNLTEDEKAMFNKPNNAPARLEKGIRNSFVKRIIDCTDLVTEFELDFMCLTEIMEVLVKATEIEKLQTEIKSIAEKCLNEAVAESTEIIE